MVVGSIAPDSLAADMLVVDTPAAGDAKTRGKICELAIHDLRMAS
jgi:hypothetical protein